MALRPSLLNELSAHIEERDLGRDDLLFATRAGTPISRNTFRTGFGYPPLRPPASTSLSAPRPTPLPRRLAPVLPSQSQGREDLNRLPRIVGTIDRLSDRSPAKGQSALQGSPYKPATQIQEDELWIR